MAFSQTDIDRIDEAIASGTVEVRYPDGSVIRYRSLSEMRAIRADMEESLAGQPKSRVTVAGF
ncbi:hypothetical protein JCM17845_15420 [Iodidimonas gelatinilytica]|uniref:Uncharacterized protein n=1 Tax=Iodidimonas gelatinilytica TaxID=1236966 RepID=A0A5A7N193_9PROT|nr:hypothetical protein [Iodidimonas gelatinilytica]GER00919.1 hypothetical protein JCM17845_15420 [Iodidimonas gelatinilytica]